MALDKLSLIPSILKSSRLSERISFWSMQTFVTFLCSIHFARAVNVDESIIQL